MSRPPHPQEFRCLHCRQVVPTAYFQAGVHNRNHCPYCLWSRHLDLRQPGDRLAACKGQMQPVGLVLKRAFKRYGLSYGELMLVHRCLECGACSINRIAADDIAENLFVIYEDSRWMDALARASLAASGIMLLGSRDVVLVRARLFGWEGESGVVLDSDVAQNNPNLSFKLK